MKKVVAFFFFFLTQLYIDMWLFEHRPVQVNTVYIHWVKGIWSQFNIIHTAQFDSVVIFIVFSLAMDKDVLERNNGISDVLENKLVLCQIQFFIDQLNFLFFWWLCGFWGVIMVQRNRCTTSLQYSFNTACYDMT